MKTKTLFIALAAVSTTILMGCSGGTKEQESEIARLKEEVRSLQAQISPGAKKKIDKSRKPFIQLGSLTEAVEYVSHFRDQNLLGKVIIPTSWKFLRSDFEMILEDSEATHVRLYAAMIPGNAGGDTLRLIAVPSDGTKDRLGTEEDPNAYDFATICPSVCPDFNVLFPETLNAEKELDGPGIKTKKPRRVHHYRRVKSQ